MLECCGSAPGLPPACWLSLQYPDEEEEEEDG